MISTHSVSFSWQLAVMSAFLGPDQTANEALLATDKDVAPWVQKYQRSRETVSQTDYEVTSIFSLSRSLKKIELWYHYSVTLRSTTRQNLIMVYRLGIALFTNLIQTWFSNELFYRLI